MSIKNKRQSSTTASPAAPASLNYGEIAIANDGTIYAGDKSNKAASKVSFADTCDLAGNAVNASAADSAVSATKASQDASGNTITTSYGAAIAISGNNIQLKSKSGAVLSTLTAPYATKAGSSNNIVIYNSDWSGTDGFVSAIYDSADKNYVNFATSNAAGTKWPPVSCNRINGHALDMSYNGNLWINW